MNNIPPQREEEEEEEEGGGVIEDAVSDVPLAMNVKMETIKDSKHEEKYYFMH